MGALVKISASIMCADFLRLGSVVKELESSGVDFLHFDIMDGHFVPNFTLGPDIIKVLREQTRLKFDTHLMVIDPERYVERFVEVGSNIIVVHVEACRHLHRTISLIRKIGAQPGVALNPATPLSALDYVLEDVDIVLVMTVDPGFAGQTMIPSMLSKIRELRSKIDERGLNAQIQVDGNVSFENAPKMVSAGAEILVAGSSSIFRKDLTITDGVKALKESIAKS